ncbi:MAG: T9SS type A sorting domain-containing protein [bacterium]
MSDAILCPNPGQDYCIAIVGAQHPKAILELYNVNGRIILQHELHQPQTRIQTASLPVGTYIYKFIVGEKVIGTGKWVKQ